MSSLIDKLYLLFVMKGYMLNQTDNLLNNSITFSFLHGRKGCFGDFMQQKIQICLYLRLLAEWAKNIALIPSNFSMKQQKNVNLIRPPYVRTTASHHRSGMWLLRKQKTEFTIISNRIKAHIRDNSFSPVIQVYLKINFSTALNF